MSRSSSSYDFPFLSDNDVQLLFEIIEAAEASKRPPYRALFSAYDEVLKRHRINWESDQKYFRFLLRMRDQKRPGQTLFEQFESLLRRLGIHVDFAKSDDAAAEQRQPSGVPEYSETQYLESTTSPPRLGPSAPARQASRRASFSSFQETTQALEFDERFLQRRRQSLEHDRQGRPVPIDTKGRQRAAAQAPHGRASDHVQSRPPRAAVSVHQSHEHRHPAHVDLKQPKTSRNPSFENARNIYKGGDGTGDSYTADYDIQEPRTEDVFLKPIAPNNHPQEQQLQAAARELRFHQIAAQSLRIFRAWAEWGRRLKYEHEELDKLAAVQDRRMLTGAALEEWHSKYRARRALKLAELETEAFYRTLEHRAEQARAIYLLTKAFTHWAQSASDEAQITSAARRHILRTRYFNAWKDTTAVYEMKARRLPLTKFFGIWKNKCASVVAAEKQASGFHDRHLVDRTYHNWFRTFCERRAAAWRENNMKDSTFSWWLERARRLDELDFLGFDYDEVRIVRNAVTRWSGRTRRLQEAEAATVTARNQLLLRSTLQSVQRAALLAPTSNLAFRLHNERIARTALLLFQERAAQYAAARSISQTRLLKKTIQLWNDALRVRTVQNLSNEHRLTNALRDWVTAGRLRLFQRVSVERARTKILLSWREQALHICSTLEDAAVYFEDYRTEKQVRSVFTFWQKQAQARLTMKEAADAHRRKKLLELAVEPWKDATTDIRAMHVRASRARFWVLSHAILKQWKGRMAEKRKERRREAYALFRSKIKRKTVADIMDSWRARVSFFSVMDETASDFYRVQLERLMRNTLETLTGRAGWLEQLQVEADEFRRSYSLSKCFDVFVDRLATVEDMKAMAEKAYDSRDARGAESALRSLNWALFQVRARDATAEGLRDRSIARNARGLLRRWEAKTRQRRESVHGAGAQTRSEVTLEENEDTTYAAPATALRDQPLGRLAAANTSGTPLPAATPVRLQAQSTRLPRRSQMAALGSSSTTMVDPATPAPAAATTGRPFLKKLRAVTPAPATVGFRRRLGMVREGETEEGVGDASPLRGRGA